MAHWEVEARRRAEAETGNLLKGMSEEELKEFLYQLIVANPYGALNIARNVTQAT